MQFDLRTNAGLIACAFHILRGFGKQTKPAVTGRREAEERRLPRRARHMATALFHIACMAEPVPREVRTEFWREALPMTHGGDIPPVSWKRAVEHFRGQWGELIEGLSGDGDVAHTRALYGCALKMMKARGELDDPEPYQVLGMMLLEIAEDRCVRNGRKFQRQFTDVRRELRGAPEHGWTRHLHDTFSMFTGERNASERGRRRVSSNWRNRDNEGGRKKRARPPGERGYSKLTRTEEPAAEPAASAGSRASPARPRNRGEDAAPERPTKPHARPPASKVSPAQMAFAF